MAESEYQWLEYMLRIVGPIMAPDPQTAWLKLQRTIEPASVETQETVLEVKDAEDDWHTVDEHEYGADLPRGYDNDRKVLETASFSYTLREDSDPTLLQVIATRIADSAGWLAFDRTTLTWTFIANDGTERQVRRDDPRSMARWLSDYLHRRQQLQLTESQITGLFQAR